MKEPMQNSMMHFSHKTGRDSNFPEGANIARKAEIAGGALVYIAIQWKEEGLIAPPPLDVDTIMISPKVCAQHFRFKKLPLKQSPS
ncbi:hypothetical protein [Paenibacillus sp. V4I5]|uniref:hypothetical protein n=1 Tax=Paenibacillus sp. V4I5 TaxID=3042306 RepID=UPI0027909605|nr:hypothetical protein [Paenibacillus sp. V4I5]MDQ0916942.1 hypothetical protein [Paenibacillus sp. V4I5]